MNCVNILFLSDLHFTRTKKKHAEIYARDIEECAKCYVDTVSGLDKEWKPQIIAIAGDIGYYGAAEDYQFFKEKFLLPLMDKLGISVDHIIMCPGNHDKDDSHLPLRGDTPAEIDWFDIKEIENPNVASSVKKTFYTGYRTSCNMQRFVLDKYAVKPFNNYINFLKEMGIPAFDITRYDYDRDDIQTDDCEYLYGYRHIEGIDFYCYNSAWDCLHYDKNDKGNLRIGPVKNMGATDDGHKLTISLVHHPHDWLSIEAVSSIKYRHTIIMDESTIAVHGHMHTSNICQDAAGKVLLVQLPTWSSPDTDFERWKSYIFRIDLDDFSYSQMILLWHRENGYAYLATADGNETHPLEMARKIESQKTSLFNILESLYRALSNNLERFIVHPNDDSLSAILDLIKIIVRTAGEIAINQSIVDDIILFYDMANSVKTAEISENLVYDELINPAEELLNRIAIENSRTRTRRRDN